MTLGAALPVPRRLYHRASPLLCAHGSRLCFSRGYSQPSMKVSRTSLQISLRCPPSLPCLYSFLGGPLLLVSKVQRPEHQCSQLDSIHSAQHGHETAVPRVLQDPLLWIYLPLSRIDMSSLSTFPSFTSHQLPLQNICGKGLLLGIECFTHCLCGPNPEFF